MGLESVELVIAIEEEFGIEIADADAAHMRTPRDVIDHISMRLSEKQRSVIAKRVREVIIAQLGIDADIYREDADFIKDFDID